MRAWQIAEVTGGMMQGWIERARSDREGWGGGGGEMRVEAHMGRVNRQSMRRYGGIVPPAPRVMSWTKKHQNRQTTSSGKAHLVGGRLPEAVVSRHGSTSTTRRRHGLSGPHYRHTFYMRGNVLIDDDSEGVFVEGLRPSVDTVPAPGSALLLLAPTAD